MTVYIYTDPAKPALSKECYSLKAVKKLPVGTTVYKLVNSKATHVIDVTETGIITSIWKTDY